MVWGSLVVNFVPEALMALKTAQEVRFVKGVGHAVEASAAFAVTVKVPSWGGD